MSFMKNAISKSELTKRIADCSPWFQNVPMPYDMYTIRRGHGNPSTQYDCLKKILPSFKNKSVLDIGCNGGYFELKLKQELEAGHVEAIDYYDKHLKQTQLVIDAYQLKECEVYKANIETREGIKQDKYDIVLFLGVLYHVENMIKTLQNVFDLANEYVLIETDIEGTPEEKQSFAVFMNYPFENGHYAGMFRPTITCVRKMIEYCGGEVVKETTRNTKASGYRYMCLVKPNVYPRRMRRLSKYNWR